MAGYFTYHNNVYIEEQNLKQLFGVGEFKVKQSARQAAIKKLKDSGLSYVRAEIHIMHYNGADYNDRNEPTITIRPKGQERKEDSL